MLFSTRHFLSLRGLCPTKPLRRHISTNQLAMTFRRRMAVPSRQFTQQQQSCFESSSSSTSTAEGGAKSSSILGGSVTLVLAWYARRLETHPIPTKSITSGLIAGAGDLLCQAVVDRPKQLAKLQQQPPAEEAADKSQSQLLFGWWSWQRTANFAVLGTFLVGPTLHYWYGGLAARFPLGSSPAKAVLTRVAWDQVLFTPPFCATWMLALWTLEKAQEEQGSSPSTPAGTVSNLGQRLVATLPTILVANWMLWIPVQCLNFWVTPVQYQVLASNCVALLWNAYLSFSTRAVATAAVVGEDTKENNDDDGAASSNINEQQQQQLRRRRSMR